ncbi:MAG: prepilin-type N-terminal cleavage/methylation domain-containing protein [Novipirellula sp. JB048]
MPSPQYDRRLRCFSPGGFTLVELLVVIGVWVGNFGANRWGGVFFDARIGALTNANSGTSPSWANAQNFSSLHPGGAHFVKADRSAGFISDEHRWPHVRKPGQPSRR